jgi:hypothetical protein
VPPETQWVPAGQYVAEQSPTQSLAAQEYGLNDVEQHFDQHAELATQPRQK